MRDWAQACLQISQYRHVNQDALTLANVIGEQLEIGTKPDMDKISALENAGRLLHELHADIVEFGKSLQGYPLSLGSSSAIDELDEAIHRSRQYAVSELRSSLDRFLTITPKRENQSDALVAMMEEAHRLQHCLEDAEADQTLNDLTAQAQWHVTIVQIITEPDEKRSDELLNSIYGKVPSDLYMALVRKELEVGYGTPPIRHDNTGVTAMPKPKKKTKTPVRGDSLEDENRQAVLMGMLGNPLLSEQIRFEAFKRLTGVRNRWFPLRDDGSRQYKNIQGTARVTHEKGGMSPKRDNQLSKLFAPSRQESAAVIPDESARIRASAVEEIVAEPAKSASRMIPDPVAEPKTAEPDGHPQSVVPVYVESAQDIQPDSALGIVSADVLAANLHAKADRPSAQEASLLVYKMLCAPVMDDEATAHDHLLDALVFLRSMVLSSPDAHVATLERQLLLASDIPLDQIHYSSLVHAEVFKEGDLLPGAELSFLLRAILAPSDKFVDYTLYTSAESLRTRSNYFPTWAQGLKQLLNMLLELKSHPGGFSAQVVARLALQSSSQRESAEMSQRAAQLMQDLPNINAHMNGLPAMRKLCLEPGSVLHNALAVIASGDQSPEKFTFIQKTLEQLNDASAIGDYVDKQWRRAADGERAGKQKLGMIARKQIEGAIDERLALIREWLAATDTTVEVSETMVALHGRLRKQIAVVQRELVNARPGLSGDDAIRARLLGQIVDSMDARLTGQYEVVNRRRFTNLLKTCYIGLDQFGQPVLDAQMDSVEGYEPWRRALQHIATPALSFEAALNAIVDANQPRFYDNLLTAHLIAKHLVQENATQDVRDYLGDVPRAKEGASAARKRFDKEMEMAYAFGRISESQQQLLAQKADVAEETLLGYGDFARWQMFLETLRTSIEREAALKLIEYERRYSRLLLDEDGEPAELLVGVRDMLDERNFTVAEEYLNRYEAGERTLLGVEKTPDLYGRFLDRYTELFSMNEKGDALRKWGPRKIRPLLDPKWASGQRSNAEQLLSDWPSNVDSPPDKLSSLFRGLGFSVENGAVRQGRPSEKYSQFSISVAHDSQNKADYAHPIAKFGTMMNSPLDVVCVFGTKTASDLVALITTNLRKGDNLIVLLDSALELPERRQLVEQFRSTTSGLHSFLLIDRVLALFLATLDQSQRLPALLMCTLPYTNYQPFNNDGGAIADEMFMGRKSELASIMDPNGHSIIYGGRQLGKTALLERACSLLNNPERREVAIMLTALDLDEQQTLAKVVKELKKKRLIEHEASDWGTLCDALSALFAAGKLNRMVLLIDEADAFLKAVGASAYRALAPLIALKRETKNAFKLVLAGLHNVARAKRGLEANGLLPQLGASLPIKPLSPMDALQLLDRPLAYLGFRADEPHLLELILASCNYYPGVLHFFGYTLVQSVSDNYRRYYSAARGNPPFLLQEEQLRTIVSSEQLNTAIRHKVRITLDLDDHYRAIANQIAYHYYCNEQLGCSVYQLHTQAISDRIRLFADMPIEDYELLLDELVDMGILAKTDQGLYRFRRNNFLAMVGSPDAVEMELLKLMED